MFTEDKRELEQWGSARIRRTLLARGIDRDVIETALEPPCECPEAGEANEFARALALLQRRFPNPPRERRDRQRALGALMRRGYEPELAVDVLNAYARGDA
jgi:regulatory protein